MSCRGERHYILLLTPSWLRMEPILSTSPNNKKQACPISEALGVTTSSRCPVPLKEGWTATQGLEPTSLELRSPTCTRC